MLYVEFMSRSAKFSIGLAFFSILCASVSAQIPQQAIDAWRRQRLRLVDLDPVRLSDKSFSFTVTNVITDEAGRSKTHEEIFVAKIDDSFLFSIRNEKSEKRFSKMECILQS